MEADRNSFYSRKSKLKTLIDCYTNRLSQTEPTGSALCSQISPLGAFGGLVRGHKGTSSLQTCILPYTASLEETPETPNPAQLFPSQKGSFPQSRKGLQSKHTAFLLLARQRCPSLPFPAASGGHLQHSERGKGENLWPLHNFPIQHHIRPPLKCHWPNWGEK